MTNLQNRRIAYRCPECGKTVIAPLNLFSLSGEPLRLECECAESALTLEMTGDKKIRITVPCLACPKNHIYKLSPSLVFEKELFVLQCTYSGLDICFLGEKANVDDALDKSEKELVSLIDYMESHADEFDDPDELDDGLEKIMEQSESLDPEAMIGDFECEDEDDISDISDLTDLSDFMQFLSDEHSHTDGCDCDECNHRDENEKKRNTP